MEGLTNLELGLMRSIGSIQSRKMHYCSVGKLPKDTPTHALYSEIVLLISTQYSEDYQKETLNRLCKNKYITYGRDKDGNIYFELK